MLMKPIFVNQKHQALDANVVARNQIVRKLKAKPNAAKS